MDISLSKLWETVKDRDAWHAAVHGIVRQARATEQQNVTNNVIPVRTKNNVANKLRYKCFNST